MISLSRRDSLLTREFALPVNVHCVDRIGFDVGTIESAIENIVRGQLNDRYFQARGRGSDCFGPAMVDREGKLGLRFREIDSGERSRVYHDVGLENR